MSMTSGTRRSLASEMNVTPLIDVLLVLLIIFMVVLPEHKRGESADIPQPESAVVDPVLTVVQLHDAGVGRRPDLKINQQDVAWDDLERKLETIFRTKAGRIAFVKGDPEIDFEYVAQAIGMAHDAGAERVGLLGGKN